MTYVLDAIIIIVSIDGVVLFSLFDGEHFSKFPCVTPWLDARPS